jgi:hypothetical protein
MGSYNLKRYQTQIHTLFLGTVLKYKKLKMEKNSNININSCFLKTSTEASNNKSRKYRSKERKSSIVRQYQYKKCKEITIY